MNNSQKKKKGTSFFLFSGQKAMFWWCLHCDSSPRKTFSEHYRWRQGLMDLLPSLHTTPVYGFYRTGRNMYLCIYIINKRICVQSLLCVFRGGGMCGASNPDGFRCYTHTPVNSDEGGVEWNKRKRKHRYPHRVGRGWWISFSYISFPSGSLKNGG